MLESDGYLLDALQGLLQRPLRDADLRRGPRRAAELRRRRPRRLGRLPGRRRRDRRAAARGHRVPLQPGGPLLRPPPQHGGLLGHERQRRPRPPQQDLRQRARPADRRRHRRRATPATRATRCWSRTTSSTRTTSTSTRRTRPSTRRSRSRSAPACGSPAATATRSATTTSTTTGAAARCSSASPTSSSAATAAGGNEQAGCDPNGQTDLVLQLALRQQHGPAARRHGRPERDGLLVGPVPGHDGNCWWDNTRRRGRAITYSPPARCPTATTARSPSESVGTGNPAQTGELLALRRRVRDAQLRPERAVPVVQDAAGAAARAAARSARRARPAFSTPFEPVVPRSAERLDRPPQRLQRRRRAPTGTRAGDDGRAWIVDKIARVRRRRRSTTRRRSSATATR